MLTVQRFHCEDFAAAYEFGRIADPLQRFSAGFVTRVEHAMFFSLAIAALYAKATAGAAVRLRRRAGGQAEAARELGGVLPGELSAHAAAGRGRVRANRRRAHRSRGSLRPRDRGCARAVVRQHRGVGRRARGAFLVRRRQTRVRQTVFGQGTERLWAVGRARQGRRPSGEIRADRRAQHHGLGHGKLHDARLPRRTQRRPRSRHRAQGEPGHRRGNRPREAARQAHGHHHGERRRGHGRVGARVRRRVPGAGNQDRARPSARAHGATAARVGGLLERHRQLRDPRVGARGVGRPRAARDVSATIPT